MDNFYSQKETFENLVVIWEKKANKKLLDLVILGFLAWAYIWFWWQIATTVATWTSEILGFGVTKMIMWAVFSIALMLVIIDWAELFTWNHLMIKAKLKWKITWTSMFRNWWIVYLTNFVWAIFIAFLIYKSGLWMMDSYHLWVTAVKIANAKVNLDFTSALIRWILCNWLVCLAIYIAISSKDIVWKIFGIFFPIMTFVACWFEHSIANMFFIPIWILLKWQAWVMAVSWLDVTNLTWYNFVFSNLVPVTIWNIIWWALFVWYFYYLVNRKD